jgi:micrococcal nuclease
MRAKPRLAALSLAALVLAAGGCRALASNGGSSSSSGRARVTSAVVDHDVDGDTLSVEIGSKREYVRFIGIDTPESVRPGTPVMCGAIAASHSMDRMAPPGTKLRLVSDPTQDSVDRYGRLLRYVELARSGKDLGGAQLKAGWADVYVYYASGPAQRVPAYRRYEAQAKSADRGVFKLCGGDFHRPAGSS